MKVQNETIDENINWDYKYGRERRHHCCPFKVALFFVYLAHLWFLKNFHDALKSFEDKGGKLEPKKCAWACNKKIEAPVSTVSAPQVNLNY
jgi:hypothetical protein